MALDTRSWSDPRRLARWLLLLLVAAVPAPGAALQPAPTWSAASAPYADPPGARWIKVDGAGGRKFLTAVEAGFQVEARRRAIAFLREKLSR